MRFMKNLLTIVFCSILVTSCRNTGTEKGFVIDKRKSPTAIVTMSQEYFPDSNFRKALQRKVPMAEGDSLTNEIVSNVEGLYLSGLCIKSLKGIEYFTALKQIDCSENLLEEIDISQNVMLERFECMSNQLARLDVTHNPLLIALGCCNNLLTELDVTKSSNLAELLCNENKIKSIDLSNCPKLYELGVVNCDLKELDATKNINLELLYCSRNKFNELDLRNNTKLRRLVCYPPSVPSVKIMRPKGKSDLGIDSIQIWRSRVNIWWSSYDMTH